MGHFTQVSHTILWKGCRGTTGKVLIGVRQRSTQRRGRRETSMDRVTFFLSQYPSQAAKPKTSNMGHD